MTIIFTPNGSLNVAHDPSDLPEASDGTNITSGAMVRCKNLRLNEMGKAITRDGSAKLNSTAIASISWLEVQQGTRYAFGSGAIYENETSIETGLASGPWSAIQYNAFNDTQLNIFALNGTDRKRIEGGAVYEWGINPPTTAPVLSSGHGAGLTGVYRLRYTYVRKVGNVVVAESDPSPESEALELFGESLAATFSPSSDDQVTHIRFYRTTAGGVTYSFDQEIAADLDYGYGYAFDWEEGIGNVSSTSIITSYEYGVCFEWEASDEDGDDPYLTGGGYKWTLEDETHETENIYTWEERYTEDVNWDAQISTTTVNGAGSSSTVTTGSVIVTVTDPNGTPTYAWTKVSGDSIFPTNPSAASTRFRASGMGLGEVRMATFQCLVSDPPNVELLSVFVVCTRTGSGGDGFEIP